MSFARVAAAARGSMQRIVLARGRLNCAKEINLTRPRRWRPSAPRTSTSIVRALARRVRPRACRQS
jgi:hypothetical protein